MQRNQPTDWLTDCGAPATAIHVRYIVKQIYGFAILREEKVQNPADEVDRDIAGDTT